MTHSRKRDDSRTERASDSRQHEETRAAEAETSGTTPQERAALRRRRIKSHRAKSFQDAEKWDLRFWQELSPQERLSAFVAIREDVEKAQAARRNWEKRQANPPETDANGEEAPDANG